MHSQPRLSPRRRGHTRPRRRDAPGLGGLCGVCHGCRGAMRGDHASGLTRARVGQSVNPLSGTGPAQRGSAPDRMGSGPYLRLLFRPTCVLPQYQTAWCARQRRVGGAAPRGVHACERSRVTALVIIMRILYIHHYICPASRHAAQQTRGIHSEANRAASRRRTPHHWHHRTATSFSARQFATVRRARAAAAAR